MSYSCKILLDSISETGKRITTFEITFPNLNSLDMLTLANLYSNRALSIERKINDYVQVLISGTEFNNFFNSWCTTDEYEHIGIRKIADLMYEAYHAFDNLEQIPNEFAGDFLRNWSAVSPQKLKVGEWHCPLVYEEDDELIENYCLINNLGLWEVSQIRKQVSVARCARVSYLTHDGKRDIGKDLELFERLRTSGHFSPFEHIAQPSFDKQRWNQFQQLKANQEEFEQVKPINIRNANFIGWRQMRQDLPDENCVYFREEEK